MEAKCKHFANAKCNLSRPNFGNTPLLLWVGTAGLRDSPFKEGQHHDLSKKSEATTLSPFSERS